jgi:uncharacterized protein with PQ loop repeat
MSYKKALLILNILLVFTIIGQYILINKTKDTGSASVPYPVPIIIHPKAPCKYA